MILDIPEEINYKLKVKKAQMRLKDIRTLVILILDKTFKENE